MFEGGGAFRGMEMPIFLCTVDGRACLLWAGASRVRSAEAHGFEDLNSFSKTAKTQTAQH